MEVDNSVHVKIGSHYYAPLWAVQLLSLVEYCDR